jgi:hypothetical protein
MGKLPTNGSGNAPSNALKLNVVSAVRLAAGNQHNTSKPGSVDVATLRSRLLCASLLLLTIQLLRYLL